IGKPQKYASNGKYGMCSGPPLGRSDPNPYPKAFGASPLSVRHSRIGRNTYHRHLRRRAMSRDSAIRAMPVARRSGILTPSTRTCGNGDQEERAMAATIRLAAVTAGLAVLLGLVAGPRPAVEAAGSVPNVVTITRFCRGPVFGS